MKNLIEVQNIKKNYGKKEAVKGISFNTKGKIMIKILSSFNTKIGTVLLAISLKFLKSIFPKLIIYNETNGPSPDMKWIIKNFEKI